MVETVLALACGTHAAHDRLTKGEIEVLRLAAAGARNSEMARALDISLKAVEARLTRLYRKMQVRSRLEAVVAAQDAGILEVASPPRDNPNDSRPNLHDQATGMQRDPGSCLHPKYHRSWWQNGNGSATRGTEE